MLAYKAASPPGALCLARIDTASEVFPGFPLPGDQKRAEIKTRCTFFVALYRSAQKGLEHLFFQPPGDGKGVQQVEYRRMIFLNHQLGGSDQFGKMAFFIPQSG